MSESGHGNVLSLSNSFFARIFLTQPRIPSMGSRPGKWMGIRWTVAAVLRRAFCCLQQETRTHVTSCRCCLVLVLSSVNHLLLGHECVRLFCEGEVFREFSRVVESS